MFLHINKIHIAYLFATVFFICFSFTGCSELPGLNDSSVTISGTRYPAETENIILTGYDSDDYSVFAKLKNLKSLDVTALDLSPDDYEKLTSQVGNQVRVIWSVPFNGDKVPNTTSELTLSGTVSSDDAYTIKYFHSLNKLSITDAEITQELYDIVSTASENNPDLQLNYSASLYGVAFDNNTEILDLNNIKIDSLDQLCLAIEIFPNIKSIEMCDCGLSNQIMQGLREEYPDIKFVWKIHFLYYTVRTDIQVFSTLATTLQRPGNSETFYPLFKYCTDLRALDLGHMAITDISEIKNLKKLHTLILADNHITDITPLAELKELVYLEIFQNRISDISPVLELPNLEDLNLCYNMRLKNPTVLVNCKKLKRLYISYCRLDNNEIKQLRNGIPSDCEFNYTAPNCVFSGWRTNANARNTKIREAFKNWRKVKEYPTWDNIIYK